MENRSEITQENLQGRRRDLPLEVLNCLFFLFYSLPVGRGGLLSLVRAGLVVAAPQEIVGEILLLHVVPRVVVRVLVALEQGALEVERDMYAPTRLYVGHSGV